MSKIVINRQELENWCYEHGIINPLDTFIVNYTEVVQEEEHLKAMPKTKNEYLDIILPLLKYGDTKKWLKAENEIITDDYEILDNWLTIVIDLMEESPDPYQDTEPAIKNITEKN